MIRVDILSPVGGKVGGIENVIKLWTKNLSQPDYVVRVIHRRWRRWIARSPRISIGTARRIAR